jgi:hypothetical protein
LDFGALANNPLSVATYPSPLVLFELERDDVEEDFRVRSGEEGTTECDADPNICQQFNVRRVAKKLTAIHLINILARNGATRHSTRVGIVWEGQDPNHPNNRVVERDLFKVVGDDLFGITLDRPPGLNFPQELCRYYSSRKTSLEDLFASSGFNGFEPLNCQRFRQLDVLDVIYLIDSGQMPWDDPRQVQGFVAEELRLSPHIIWIGTRTETFEIFLRRVFIHAIQEEEARNVRPVLTAILFPTTSVSINTLARLLAYLNLIDWDTERDQVRGLTFRSPFFNIFVFDGCGYIDVPRRASNNDSPLSPYWECLTENINRLDGNVFQDFLRAFAEGNAMPQFPERNLAPFVQEGRVPGDTIAQRLAVYIYREFLTSRGWLF